MTIRLCEVCGDPTAAACLWCFRFFCAAHLAGLPAGPDICAECVEEAEAEVPGQLRGRPVLDVDPGGVL